MMPNQPTISFNLIAKILDTSVGWVYSFAIKNEQRYALWINHTRCEQSELSERDYFRFIEDYKQEMRLSHL